MDIDPKIQALQDRRLMLIGHICTQWSYLEYILLRSMRRMLSSGDDELGKILFGGLDMRPRIAMAIDMARHLKFDTKLVDALVTARAEIDGGLLKRRNRAIHGVQFLYTDGDLHVEIHRGKDRARRQLSENELWQIGADIRKSAIKLNVVINRVLWDMDPPPYALLEKPVKQPRKRKAPKPDQTPKPRAPRRKASPGKSQSQ